jgi:hypothetical protein
MRKLKFVIIALLVIGAAGLAVWKFYIKKPVSSIKNVQPDFTITMQDLFKEAAANDSATKVKYIDKIVSVKGMVKEVLANDSASVINLGDSTSENLIKCQIFKEDNDETVKNLKPNTIITIKGRFAGLQNQSADPTLAEMGIALGTDIEMKYCAIIQNK